SVFSNRKVSPLGGRGSRRAGRTFAAARRGGTGLQAMAGDVR
ncbi:MAG: hypothetical protein RIT02_1182, partial [Planctomycetota bacterium]